MTKVTKSTSLNTSFFVQCLVSTHATLSLYTSDTHALVTKD